MTNLTRRGVIAAAAASPFAANGAAREPFLTRSSEALVSTGSFAAPVEPVTQKLLESYSAWLHFERKALCFEMYQGYGLEAVDIIPMQNEGCRFGVATLFGEVLAPSTRARLVLAAAGVPEDTDRTLTGPAARWSPTTFQDFRRILHGDFSGDAS